MPTRQLSNNPTNHALTEDWEGNNAAFTCPLCGKVFIVRGAANIHNGVRRCPNPTCGKSTGHVEGGRMSGGSAWIEWQRPWRSFWSGRALAQTVTWRAWTPLL